ncbi:hypothetical protein [Geobacillus sp. C56-T2]|nr:hypothetical protein [Geobacillus sp. C56-T2]
MSNRSEAEAGSSWRSASPTSRVWGLKTSEARLLTKSRQNPND